MGAPGPEKVEEYRAALRARGVPTRFVEEIATRHDGWTTRGGGVGAIVAVIVAWLVSFIVLTVVGTGLRAAIAAAWNGDAWLSAPSGDLFHGGLLLLFLGGFLVAPGIVFAVASRIAPYPAPSLAAADLRSGGKPALLPPDPESADDVLRAHARRLGRNFSRVGLVLVLPGLLMMAAGFPTHWSAGPNGLTRWRASGAETFAWTDATLLVTGCHGRRFARGAALPRDRLVYEVHFRVPFADTLSVDLARAARAVTGGDRAAMLAGLERVDAALRRAGVPQRSHRGGFMPNDERRCLERWAETAGPDGLKRVRALVERWPFPVR